YFCNCDGVSLIPYASLTKSFARYTGSAPRLNIDGEGVLPPFTFISQEIKRLPCKDQTIRSVEIRGTFRIQVPVQPRHFSSSPRLRIGESLLILRRRPC